MKSSIKKSIVVSTIVFMILASISTTTTANTKSFDNNEPIGNEPKLVIFLPDAHLYYHPLKFRYADVEFDESGVVIDVNLSEITSNEVILDFHQQTFAHVENQLISVWVNWMVSLSNDSELRGAGGISTKIRRNNNWQTNLSFGFTRWNVSELGIYPLNIALTGIPAWLPFLHWIHFGLDALRSINRLPFPKIFGGTVTYQLDVHT